MATIAKTLGFARSTVQNTIQKPKIRPPNGASKPRTGRPRITDIRQRRLIIRKARADPPITITQLVQDIGGNFTHVAVYRILKEAGIATQCTKETCKKGVTEDTSALATKQ
jgi:transposase